MGSQKRTPSTEYHEDVWPRPSGMRTRISAPVISSIRAGSCKSFKSSSFVSDSKAKKDRHNSAAIIIWVLQPGPSDPRQQEVHA